MPSLSILAEPPVALVDGKWSTSTARARSPRPISSSSTRRLARRSSPRTTTGRSSPSRADPADLARFPKIKLVTIDEAFGGWTQGAGRAFRRRRHVRPDLQARRQAGDAMSVAVAARLDAVARAGRASCRASASRFGFTVTYLSLIVLIPLAALVVARQRAGPRRHLAGGDRRRACWRRCSVSFVVSAAAALVNAVFGVLVAWVLVRYRFPGRRIARRRGRPALRAADRGRRHRAGGALCAERLDRRACSRRWASRSPSRRSASSSRWSSSACPSWCARCSRCCRTRPRDRGGLGDPGRRPLPDRVPRRAAAAPAGAADRRSRSPSPAPSANTAR